MNVAAPATRRRPPTLPALQLALLIAFANYARAASAPPPPNLQAYGSEKRIWFARVEPVQAAGASGEMTTLFVREKASNEWRRLNPIGARVVTLGSRGSQLAVLLPDGAWSLTTDDGLTSGRPLPYGAKIITIGGDGKSLWAVGQALQHDVEVGLARASTTNPVTGAASQPSTAPTTTTTTTNISSIVSTTEPAISGPMLRLFRLGAQAWEDQGPLPEAIAPGERLSLELGAAGGLPLLAQLTGPRQIRVYRLAANQLWEVLGDVGSPTDIQLFKVLGGTSDPMLWLRGEAGVNRLWVRGSAGGDAALHDVKGVPAGVEHVITCANGAIRALWIEQDKILDQRLKPNGEPDGDKTPMPLPGPDLQPKVVFWGRLVLMTAFAFALAASFRRRREMQELELDPSKLRLAPFSLRFIAGMVDASPLFVASYLVGSRHPAVADMSVMIDTLGGTAVYIVFTMLVELIAGRSLGKLATGLYVVGLDGKVAPLGARVIRNLLRVIDIATFGTSLALILFSPLRQRAGDLAAGTLVIHGKPGKRLEESDERPKNEDRDRDEKDKS